jgi:hypothetical protein
MFLLDGSMRAFIKGSDLNGAKLSVLAVHSVFAGSSIGDETIYPEGQNLKFSQFSTPSVYEVDLSLTDVGSASN